MTEPGDRSRPRLRAHRILPAALGLGVAGGHAAAAPAPVDDTFVVVSRATSTLAGNVLGNDSGSGLSAVPGVYALGVASTASLAGNGDLTVTISSLFADFNACTASDRSFAYNVVDSTSASANALVHLHFIPAIVDDSYTVPAGQPSSGVLNANDNYTGGVTYNRLSNATHGSVSLDNVSSAFIYTPAAGFSGQDAFSYQALGGGVCNAITTVLLTVLPVAGDDSYTTPYATPLAANVLGNDVGSNLSAAVLTTPQHGSLSLAPNGDFSYTPAAGFSGSDGFTYAVQDASGQNASATVAISVGNGAPLANPDSFSGVAGQTLSGDVLANDSDPNGDPLTVYAYAGASHGVGSISPAGVLNYTPDPGYSGPDQLSYAISDGNGGNANGVASLLIVPYAGADSFGAAYGSAISGNVLGNDLGSNLVASLSVAPQHGTLALAPDGSFSYTPDAGFSGSDGFDYRVTDTYGSSVVAHVSLAVGGAPAEVPTLDRGALGLLGGLLAWLGLRRRPRRA